MLLTAIGVGVALAWLLFLAAGVGAAITHLGCQRTLEARDGIIGDYVEANAQLQDANEQLVEQLQNALRTGP